MFSKKICAGLCALGMLGAINANTKVSAANTFQSIAEAGHLGSALWGYFKAALGVTIFTINQAYHDSYRSDHKGTPYLTIGGLSAFLAVDGFSNMSASLWNVDGAMIETFKAIAKNDPVYADTYVVLANNPIELTDKNVKDVIDNVKKLKEAYEKYEDKSLDPAQRLLAKDACKDAAKNLKEIANGTKDSKDNDEPQLYKRRNR